MGAVKSCCSKQIDEKLMVAKLDLSHCGCLEVPHIVFNAERCIETLILASNQITSLPPQLFHCQEMKHLNINDNCLNSIPPAIGSFINLVSLKLDKNNLQELPENLKMCKKLKRLSLNNNPWKQMPNIVTQIISLEELYMNDCELNYLPASVGRLAKLKIIELRNNNLCNLPLSMTRLENLTRLDISDNEFNEFPNCITKLKSLTELLLDNNDIEEITDIKNLVHLEHLDASYNHLLVISETIGCCTLLNMLNLSFNYIEQLPNSIGNITHLQTLHLEMNELTEIPKSVGKLSHLEELNLCNNKLYSLPNTIGLLRNLRNLNVSRNMIEEFPPEIGSCTKLAIINAAYNRLQVLPSEIGYLNNLKVLDLVGNFLMYLPITIINLRGLRAIWLSANQNVPLIPFTEDLNIASGERFLTNIALPQVGEIPLRNANSTIQKDFGNEKSSSWNKKIRFAEDEEILPGKLHRTPTPFPKELRSPNRKHHRNEEPKPCDNYVNVVDGKVAEQEVSLLQPPSVPVTKTGSGLLNYSESCVTRIREANIRRNNREGFELPAQDPHEFHEEHHDTVNNEREYPRVSEPDKKESQVPVQMEILPEPPRTDVSLTMEQTSKSQLPAENREPTQEKTYSPGLPQVMFDNSTNYNNENWSPKSSGSPERFPSQLDNSYRQQVIYSNLVNNGNSGEDSRCQEEGLVMEPQKIREMYHNDVIYESNMNRPIYNDSRTPSRTDYYNANVEPQSKYFCTNSTNYRDNHFIRTASLNANHDECRRVYSTPPPPPPPPTAPFNCNAGGECDRLNGPPPPPPPPLPPPNVNPSECSSQDLAALAEQMKNRKIAPPCYEIAKMYSTKAALFENQLKTN